MFPFLARSYLAMRWLLTIFMKFSPGKILLWSPFIFSWFVMNCLFQDQQVHFNKTMTTWPVHLAEISSFFVFLLGSPGKIEPHFGALCAIFGQPKRIRFQVPKTWSFCHGTADSILISVQSLSVLVSVFFAAVKDISILFWVYRKIFYFRMYFVMNWF